MHFYQCENNRHVITKVHLAILLRKSEGGGLKGLLNSSFIETGDPLGAPVATAQWLLIKGTP